MITIWVFVGPELALSEYQIESALKREIPNVWLHFPPPKDGGDVQMGGVVAKVNASVKTATEWLRLCQKVAMVLAGIALSVMVYPDEGFERLFEPA